MENNKKLTSLPHFKRPFRLLLSLLIILLVFFLNNCSNTKDKEVLTKLKKNDNVFGNLDSKVTIIEYVDNQCPACKSFNKYVFKRVWRVLQKDVKWIFRNFPLKNIHQYAEISAYYNEAAGKQKKFLEFHDILFAKQNEWSKLASKSEVEKKFLEYAETLKLNTDLLKEDAHSKEIEDKVNQDLESAEALGLTGTPSILINGEKINITSSAEDFFNLVIQEVKKHQDNSY